MSKSYKCIVCLDSGYLAIHKDNPDDIVPMSSLSGSQLADYRITKCTCKQQAEEASRVKVDDSTKRYQNWQPAQMKL